MVKYLLHLEGALFFFVALYLFSVFDGNWFFFILLLFTPDISMIGYFINKKVGAFCYNAIHNYALGIIVIALGLFIFDNTTIIQIGIILFAHVALDRAIGYGLKYPTGFKHTHLQKV